MVLPDLPETLDVSTLWSTRTPEVRAGVRVLRDYGVAVLAGFATWACTSASADLDSGGPVPSFARPTEPLTILLAASVEDCLGCGLQQVFVALRALETAATPEIRAPVIVLAVGSDPADTTTFRAKLIEQRITSRVQHIGSREAVKFMNVEKLPAVYLVREGHVVEAWEPPSRGGTVTIGRRELIQAVRRTEANRPDAPGAAGPPKD